MKSDHYTLNESHDQLQTQLKRYNVPSTPSSSFGKEDLARSSQHKGKGVIDEILSRQRSNNSKEGLGYIPKIKSKKNKKNKTAQLKTSNITNDKTNYDGFAGINNPNFELYCDSYGDVYASYVGLMIVTFLGLFGFPRPLLLT